MGKFILLICLLIISIFSQGAPAKDSVLFLVKPDFPVLKDKYYNKILPRFKIDTSFTLPLLTIHLGGAIAVTDGSIQLHSENPSGTDIDMERDLGFPATQFMPRLNIFLRLGKQQNFIFDIYSVRRRENTILPRDIQYGNALFKANSIVSSKFHVTTYHLAYRLSFIRKQRYDVGALVGITALNYSLRLRDPFITEREGLFLPAPLIGLDGFVFLSKRVFVRGVAKFFTVKFSNLHYSLFSIKPYIEYYFTHNIGAGIRYHFAYSSVDEISSKSFDGSFRYQFHAVSLFASFRFF